MSGFKGIAKGGWHPKGKGEGGRESWRSDFKGVNTVAGWMGKGKNSHAEQARDHQSAPLSTLKDPASFGPPPKHIHYHGATASPNSPTPDSGGLGSPISAGELSARQRLQEKREVEAREEEEAVRPPSGPYRANTTGLSTVNLPKPPVRRSDAALLSASDATKQKQKPKLPPRLPPRQNSYPDTHAPPPPPPYSESPQNDAPGQGNINQGAMDRLGRAGISVPGFNIGRTASPPVPARQSPSPNTPVSPLAPREPRLNELQSRFAKVSISSSGSQAPNAGTSWTDKQAALKTANNLRNDPANVSVSDIRSAASTANNFRERHGEKVASSWQSANNLNLKYGISDRVNSYTSPASPPPQSPTQGGHGKKHPPPPPPKKKNLAASGIDEPPPIPLSSKPKF
ncbi:hypothetical protein CC78DRAFT_207474 [Lojkania enalia]|uniref:Uncharacterized protein n=1 Tax=Lojkania enalia TaxID=147567 RepID=A0A9P4KB02_9PLEO|nr:hypothetical protein CC78DRAFT_207474 [Didymosphaeria enalia]